MRPHGALVRHDPRGPHDDRASGASYGDRTAEAERADGVYWKALSHAVRVGREAIELFTTGRLHFPLACAPHLLAIKLGQVPHTAVIAEIDAMLADAERAAAMSTLPDEPDVIAAETLVCRAHRAQVLEAVASARCRQSASFAGAICTHYAVNTEIAAGMLLWLR